MDGRSTAADDVPEVSGSGVSSSPEIQDRSRFRRGGAPAFQARAATSIVVTPGTSASAGELSWAPQLGQVVSSLLASGAEHHGQCGADGSFETSGQAPGVGAGDPASATAAEAMPEGGGAPAAGAMSGAGSGAGAAGAGLGSVIAEPGGGSGWAAPDAPPGRVVRLAMAETLAPPAGRRTTRWYVRLIQPGYPGLGPECYSHSIVAGGFELMSYTTRLTPGTSLTIRALILPSTSYGSFAQSAVIPSSEVTARMATTLA